MADTRAVRVPVAVAMLLLRDTPHFPYNFDVPGVFAHDVEF